MAKETGAPPQPTRSLKQFAVLLGEWETVGKHVAIDAPLHGHATFEWLSENALLIWRSHWDDHIPSAISVIGQDDTSEPATLLYTDVRGVARIFQTSLDDGVWKMWRLSPGFSQRTVTTFSEAGRVMQAQSDLAREADDWKKDLVVTFTRKA